jgi:hypothetical protein
VGSQRTGGLQNRQIIIIQGPHHHHSKMLLFLFPDGFTTFLS